MPTIAQLVQDYSERLRQATNSDIYSRGDIVQKTFASFQSEVASLSGVESDIVAGLTSLLTERDLNRRDLWITAAGVHPSPAYVPALCSLLSVRDAYLQHEWIADILREIRSPDAIDALRDACSFDMPSDPAHQLSRVCLGALWTIATPAAFEAIRSQLHSPWPEVRDEARRLLEIAA
jgi:HEAT repeat protein